MPYYTYFAGYILLLSGLLYEACQDIKHHEITLCSSAMLVSAALLHILLVTDKEDNQLLLVIVSAIPGLVICGISLLLKGMIGLGDGIMFVFVGLCTGLYRCIFIIFCTFLINAFISVCLIVLKKARKKYEIPVIPQMFTVVSIMFVLDIVNICMNIS